MRDSLQDLYARCLPSDYGYPLRFPEPISTLPSTAHKEHGLKIGDVGYVNGDGAFDVLFNISFHPGHAINQRLGDSLTFDPVGLNDYEVDVNHNVIPLGHSITSSGITQPRAQTLRRPGHYEFTPSSAKGAILILPDGATSFNLSAPINERFRKLAMEEAFDWYRLAQDICGDNIKNGSLYLLTGFYKAQCWSLASFNDATVAEDRHIWVAPRVGGSTAAGRVWQCTFGLDYRDGPGPGQYGTVNQTVFIRGFKIAVREDVLGYLSQKPEILSVPPVPPRKDPCGFARWLIRRFCKINTPKRRRRANAVADVDRVPRLSQPFHPSDIITQYLLDKDPNALVAVTHDSEWTTLIEMGKLMPEELTQKDRVEEALSEHYLLDLRPKNSAVCLQGKSTKQEVLPTSETSWYNKPFNSNFQVVISSIRAEDIVSGFGRMPVGFCVVVQFDGTKRRTQNKPVRLHESIVEWDEKIRLPSEPSAKVQLSVCASFEFSPMLGTGEVLRTAEICVGDLVDNTRLIIFPATGGESVSPCSSLKLVMKRQHSHTSGGGSDHNVDFDWEESSNLARLTDQGHKALLRYCTDSRRESVADSVKFFECALATCPSHHHCYAAVLCNLAKAYFINYQLDPGSMGLSASISYYRKALELRPTGHPDRVATLLHLTGALLYHYGKRGFEEDPGEITRLVSEVQGTCPEDSHERRAVDLALQTYALYEAITSVSLVVINKLIPELRQAVHDIPCDYFDRLQRLSNLALALWVRYEFGGDLGDLDDSISTCKEAMRFATSSLDSRTYTQLLKEREKVTLASGSWKDALVTATGFVFPRLPIYRVLCERLETADWVIDAAECFHEMTNELGQEAQAKEAEWISAFRSRCCGKLESLGDIAMNARQYNDAISRYSVALSLDPATPQGFFIKRSKAFIAVASWNEALGDANKVIELDPSSPWGYVTKYVAMYNAGNYDNAAEEYKALLSRISESPVRTFASTEQCYHYISDITAGGPHNRSRQASIFVDLSQRIIKTDEHPVAIGGSADVYKCLCDSGAGLVEVAVKRHRFPLMVDETESNGDNSRTARIRKIIRRQCEIWRQLEHPNIVPFLGIAYGFLGQGYVSLVSLWMPNATLRDFLGKYDGGLTIAHRLQLLSDIANGLHYLHAFTPAPIVHGDLSSNNILLDHNYIARLIDFDYASVTGEILEALHLQISQMEPGAIRFAAPEAALADEGIQPTTQTDIYSFGSIALLVLSGKHPWSEVKRESAIIVQLLRGKNPKRPSSRLIEDPHWEFIERCWSSVGERPVAGDVVSSLQQFLHSYPPPLPLVDLCHASSQ